MKTVVTKHPMCLQTKLVKVFKLISRQILFLDL